MLPLVGRYRPIVLVTMGALAAATAAVAAAPALPRACTAADAGTTVATGSGSRQWLRTLVGLREPALRVTGSWSCG
jgi:hypothetical protein